MCDCTDIVSQNASVCSSWTIYWLYLSFKYRISVALKEYIDSSVRLPIDSWIFPLIFSMWFSKWQYALLSSPFQQITVLANFIWTAQVKNPYRFHDLFLVLHEILQRKGWLLPPMAPHPMCNKLLHINRFHVLFLSTLLKLLISL